MANGAILNQTQSNSLLLDGTKAMEAALNMGNNRIINLANAVNNNDAVNLSQLTASNTKYSNSSTSSVITSGNVQGAIDQLFGHVSDGKVLIADAITDKGVSTSSSATFQTMANNIGRIDTGMSYDYASRTLTPQASNRTSSTNNLSFSGLSFGSQDNVQLVVIFPYSVQDGREWVGNCTMWIWGPLAGVTGEYAKTFLWNSNNRMNAEGNLIWTISFGTSSITLSSSGNIEFLYGCNSTSSNRRITMRCIVIYNN